MTHLLTHILVLELVQLIDPQITEALVHLHFSARLILRGICPQSVIVTRRGAWKLAGMEFVERCSDGDIMVSI